MKSQVKGQSMSTEWKTPYYDDGRLVHIIKKNQNAAFLLKTQADKMIIKVMVIKVHM